MSGKDNMLSSMQTKLIYVLQKADIKFSIDPEDNGIECFFPPSRKFRREIAGVFIPEDERIHFYAFVAHFIAKNNLRNKALRFCNQWNNGHHYPLAILHNETGHVNLEYTWIVPAAVDEAYLKEAVVEVVEELSPIFFASAYRELFRPSKKQPGGNFL